MSAAGLVSSAPLLLAAPVALAAGALSFASPCVLPLVPGYLSYVTGLTGADLDALPAAAPRAAGPGVPSTGGVAVLERTSAAATVTADARVRGRLLAGAGLFVLGFTAVFTLEGALFGGVGSALTTHRRLLEQVLGSVTVVLGLVFAGALQRVPLATRELRIHLRPGVGLAGAPVLGVLFGLGWTPCLGPTLSAVLGLSSVTATAGRGAVLSAIYCLGLGLPFLGVALAYRRGLAALSTVRRHARAVTVAGGLLLVVVGVLEVSGAWQGLITLLRDHVGVGQTAL